MKNQHGKEKEKQLLQSKDNTEDSEIKCSHQSYIKSMSLKDAISEDTKTAMRSKDAATLGSLRLLSAAIKQKEVDEQKILNDDDVLVVIQKMLKQRQDSIEAFQKANRIDLLEKEQFEVQVLSRYMPEQLSPDEVEKIVLTAIEASAANSMKDMGKVMAALKDQLAGRANMGQVSQIIKSKLS